MKFTANSLVLLSGLSQIAAWTIPHFGSGDVLPEGISDQQVKAEEVPLPGMVNAGPLERTLAAYAATCAAVGIGNIVYMYDSANWCMRQPENRCAKAIEDEIWTISKKALIEARARWAGLIHNDCDHDCARHAGSLVATVALTDSMLWAREEIHGGLNDPRVDNQVRRLIFAVMKGGHPFVMNQDSSFEMVQHLMAFNTGESKHESEEDDDAEGTKSASDVKPPSDEAYAMVSDDSIIGHPKGGLLNSSRTAKPVQNIQTMDPELRSIAELQKLCIEAMRQSLSILRDKHAEMDEQKEKKKPDKHAEKKKVGWEPWKPDFKMKDGGHVFHDPDDDIAAGIAHVGLHALPAIIETILILFGLFI